MITKVYELTGMDACRMQTVYCGVRVNLEFKNGNHVNGKNASLITSNPFVQDAIENDPRFGIAFRLSGKYEREDVVRETSRASEERRPSTVRSRKKMKTQEELDSLSSSVSVSSSPTIVEDVRNVNDAIDYFASKGETVEDEEQIAVLIDKYKVVFPNMTVNG